MENKLLLILLLTVTVVFAANLGDSISPFSAQDDTGALWHSDSSQADYLVVYFYPAAMTFGCTKQACSYRDTKDEFADLKAEVVGVSGDEIAALQVFRQVHNLNFTLLSDPKGKIAEHFGVPISDGGEITQKINGENIILKRGVTTKRWTYIIDKSGLIIYKDDGVNPLADAKKVLKELKEK
ncbi:MAG: peroxiredoxin [Candidatus Marinimicrobia bacterium]|nr:peroxiredoxin [Candidatus Neomarinimicrobiota bacterium]